MPFCKTTVQAGIQQRVDFVAPLYHNNNKGQEKLCPLPEGVGASYAGGSVITFLKPGNLKPKIFLD